MNDMEVFATLLVLNTLLIPMLFFGILLCCGKGADLIAGYNTASEAERSRWNEKALCRGTGVLVLSIAGSIELSLVGSVLNVPFLFWAGVGLAFLSTVGGLAYINTSKRFKKE